MKETKILVEETNLEDLIVLGEECHIPIIIEFPKQNGDIIKAKALIKQLTLKGIKKVNLKKRDEIELAMEVVQIGLLKQDGSYFNKEELLALPLGVVRKLSDKILELSGFDVDNDEKIKNF